MFWERKIPQKIPCYFLHHLFHVAMYQIKSLKIIVPSCKTCNGPMAYRISSVDHTMAAAAAPFPSLEDGHAMCAYGRTTSFQYRGSHVNLNRVIDFSQSASWHFNQKEVLDPAPVFDVPGFTTTVTFFGSEGLSKMKAVSLSSLYKGEWHTLFPSSSENISCSTLVLCKYCSVGEDHPLTVTPCCLSPSRVPILAQCPC